MQHLSEIPGFFNLFAIAMKQHCPEKECGYPHIGGNHKKYMVNEEPAKSV
jgi:hypothetical protein